MPCKIYRSPESMTLWIHLSSICLLLLLSVGSVQAAPPAPVPATGQKTSYAAGDDGELQSGVPWPSPRFLDNKDGTVSDTLTGLVWLRDAGCIGLQDWNTSFTQVTSLAHGTCGLIDSSAPGDWRLPNVLELFSLIDLGNSSPALAANHPFIDVSSEFYWASTTLVNNTVRGRPVHLGFGMIDQSDKTVLHYVLPVRGQ